MVVLQIKKFKQYEAAISGKSYSLMYFYMPYCHACVSMSPVIERIANARKMSDKIKFYKINDSSGWAGLSKLEEKLNIDAFPTMLIFHESKIVARYCGSIPRKEFEDWLLFNTAKNKIAKCSRFLDPAKYGAPVQDSPLIYGTSMEDLDSCVDSNWPKPVFATLSLPGTSYHRSLERLLQRTALLMAGEATHILLSMDVADEVSSDYAEMYFLQHRPFCMVVIPSYWPFSECKFTGGEASEHLGNWIKECINAMRILHDARPEDYAPPPENEEQEHGGENEIEENEESGLEHNISGDETGEEDDLEKGDEEEIGNNGSDGDDAEEEEEEGEVKEGDDEGEEDAEAGNVEDDGNNVTEISSTVDLFEKVHEVSNNDGILVVLCYDDSPYSKAMVAVHEVASKLAYEGSNVEFCRVDYENYDAFVQPLHLDQGPTTIVYRDKGELASKRGALELKHYEEWLKQVFELPKRETYSRVESSVKSSIRAPSTLRSESRASSATSKWEEVPEENLLHGRLKCDGIAENDRERPRALARLLRSPKPFHDRERGCVIVPHDAQEGLQLGRACSGQSAFNLTLRLSPDDPLKILFKVEFSADVNLSSGGRRARFESATLVINFGYDDADGTSHALKLREVHPKHMKGTETSVHYGKGSETSLGLDVGYSVASITAEGKLSRNASFSRVTMPRVKGSGDLSPRAQWTFEEDGGEAGQNGLDNSYELSVLLTNTPIPMGEIWMTFWGQAVLWLPHVKETIKLGSNEEPFKRVLPLPIDSD